MILNNNFYIEPTPQFEKEFDNILYYLENVLKKPITKNHFFKKVTKGINSLSLFPERFVRIPYKDKNRNLRRLLVNNYVIIYEVKKDTRSNFNSTYLS